MFRINSERLVLRDWRESDRLPWAAMNADPEVRECLGAPLTTEDAVASVRGFQDDPYQNGFGFRAVKIRASGEFIGFTGLDVVDDGCRSPGLRSAGG